jgi:hypothetical protein
MLLQTEQGETKGERVLEDASCGAVADAAVVVLAWMIDPTAMANETRAPPPVPAAPTIDEAKPVAPAPRRAKPMAPFFGLATTGDTGTLPTFAMGVEARAGARIELFRLSLYGAYFPTSSKTATTLPDGRSAGGKFTLLAFGLRGCFAPSFGESRAGFSLCAGPEVETMRGTGFGVSVPAQGTKTWVAGAATAEGTLSVGGGLRLFLMISVVVPSVRERFALEGVGEVHQPSQLAGRAAAGFEWTL